MAVEIVLLAAQQGATAELIQAAVVEVGKAQPEAELAAQAAPAS